MMLQFTGIPYALFLFMLPWYRATVLSGDRVAYVCCGDLDVSLQSVYAALVGKSAAKQLRGEGMTGQALMARKRFFLRLSQLMRGTPLATNRYLQLLAFVSSYDKVAFEGRRAELGTTSREVENVLVRLAGRRPRPHAPAVGIIAAGLLLGSAVVFGLATPSAILASALQQAEYGESAADAGGRLDRFDGHLRLFPWGRRKLSRGNPFRRRRATGRLRAGGFRLHRRSIGLRRGSSDLLIVGLFLVDEPLVLFLRLGLLHEAGGSAPGRLLGHR
jgi:hypothetical protein